MKVIAIVRKNEELFMMRDPVTKHTGFFNVAANDTYREKEPHQITFSDLNEDNMSSMEILTISIADPKTKEPIRLCDLEFEDVADIVDTMYEENKDAILAGSASTAKH